MSNGQSSLQLTKNINLHFFRYILNHDFAPFSLTIFFSLKFHMTNFTQTVEVCHNVIILSVSGRPPKRKLCMPVNTLMITIFII